MDRTLVEYTPDIEVFESEAFGPAETEWSIEPNASDVSSESNEMELAANLLEVTSESELENFIRNLIRKAGQAAGKFVSSSTGQALGGILKDAAKQALPMVGRAFGGYLGGARGAEHGAQFAQSAAKLFGLELEGLSPEDQEFEAAKSFVRFANEAVKNATAAPPTVTPQAAAQAAALRAARRFAPGLLRLRGVSTPQSTGQFAGVATCPAGRWVRRGSNIIIVNC